MAWVNVLAGSFVTGAGHHYSDGRFRLLTAQSPHAGEDIAISELTELSPADPRSDRLFAIVSQPRSRFHWLTSPVRAIARLLPQDPQTHISFQVKFKDGRRMIAKTDIKTFKEIDRAVNQGYKSTEQVKTTSNVASISSTARSNASERRRTSAADAFSSREEIEKTMNGDGDKAQPRGRATVTPLRKI